MSYNLLLNEIYKIQIEYKELLIKILPILNSPNSPIALDEIGVFWDSKIKIINLYMKHYVRNKNTYVFTASTYLNIQSNDHLRFLALGEVHIYDDPLSVYAIRNINGIVNNHKMLKIIKLTAEDNIKIISECKKNILIFPFKLLNIENNLIFNDIKEQYFCSMFDGVDSIDDYFEKCITFDEINYYLKERAKKNILFSECDDISLPFEQRYMKFKNLEYNNIEISSDDCKIFLGVVFGNISQSMDILLSCLEYGCIPFIRYTVALHYIILLSSKFEQFEYFDKIKFIKNKAIVAHFVYNNFNVDENNVNSIEQFVGVIKENNFEENLFDALETNGEIDINNSLMGIVNLYLDKIYDDLK